LKLFVVIGLGQFGRSAASALFAGGGDVIAIDQDEERVQLIKNEVGQAICADATNIDVLRDIGVAKADTAVLALGEENLEESILCCTAVHDLGVGRIIVRAATELHGRILMRVGATRIIYPEKQMGEQLAQSIISASVLDQVTLSTGQTVAHIYPRRELIGKTLRDAALRERYRLAVIGIQQPRRSIDDKGEVHEELVLHSVPGPDDIIEGEDILIVVGTRSQIEMAARKD
jgi:trk system potassium uptake protein TrkA